MLGNEAKAAAGGNAVDSQTVLYSVIGDPIRHSKSPVMMNRAFRETGLNGVYTAFHVASDRLGDFAAGVRAMGIRGVNVTIPHKLDIMDHLDAIDESARIIGAVNTIVNDEGKLTGYNTDGLGYVRSLKEEAEPDLAGKRVLIVGAGGATRGILYALTKEGVRDVTVANRTAARAEELAELFRGRADIRTAALNRLPALCGEADIVINTTSIGMFPNTDESPVEAAWLREGAIASDLIYNPLKTKFLTEAQERGLRIHGGLGMFIYQGAYAFEYWTGVDAPVAAMREAVLDALGASATG
ncbi:shikimate dehydrogenase [Paenibacillus methanolicus]|uniref:Shikimate dehydrogenase (NADP(+)) n=1 Tax=Paenibacillus methanolicus TaxID=582686 RepID=A0A5S5CJ74_9BACL|nr:shikimate dehydrogenase [Paenibacillus methanolicus]TYP78063.1 shikimate dehydrogenase [Paenibacillus methanolicus]